MAGLSLELPYLASPCDPLAWLASADLLEEAGLDALAAHVRVQAARLEKGQPVQMGMSGEGLARLRDRAVKFFDFRSAEALATCWAWPGGKLRLPQKYLDGHHFLWMLCESRKDWGRYPAMWAGRLVTERTRSGWYSADSRLRWRTLNSRLQPTGLETETCLVAWEGVGRPLTVFAWLEDLPYLLA